MEELKTASMKKKPHVSVVLLCDNMRKFFLQRWHNYEHFWNCLLVFVRCKVYYPMILFKTDKKD